MSPERRAIQCFVRVRQETIASQNFPLRLGAVETEANHGSLQVSDISYTLTPRNENPFLEAFSSYGLMRTEHHQVHT
jgi:hypothetical protein